jgi:hypothetical protein
MERAGRACSPRQRDENLIFALDRERFSTRQNFYRPCEKSGVRPFTMCVSRALMDFCCLGLESRPRRRLELPERLFASRFRANVGIIHPATGRHQPYDAEYVERPSQIVYERRQPELGSDLVE